MTAKSKTGRYETYWQHVIPDALWKRIREIADREETVTTRWIDDTLTRAVEAAEAKHGEKS